MALVMEHPCLDEGSASAERSSLYNRAVNHWKTEGRRDLWLPVLVALAGILVSLAVWGLLVEDRRAELAAAAEATASQTRMTIELALQDQLEIVTGLQQLWQTFGLRPTDEWTANVGQRVDYVSGLTSLTWAERGGTYRRIATGSRPPASAAHDPSGADEVAEGKSVSRRYDEVRGPMMEGPERDASGGFAYRIVLPVETPDARRGVLIARFDVEEVLEHVLTARSPGYALTVSWDGEAIFARGVPAAAAWLALGPIEAPVALPLGGAWTVLQHPTAALTVGRVGPAFTYLLSAGILLSLVVAVLVHQLRVIVRQSRFLEASNLALEKRGVELESKVAERTEALQDAVTELEAFNYSVSHDLRSPLGAILNFATILEEDHRDRPLDAAGIAILERIRRSANRAMDLLEDLLKLSRAGRAALELERIDMAALARETFTQVRVAAADDEIELIVDALPEAIGDRTLLGDVFANLFSNALKYSRGGEKRSVRVVGYVSDDEGERAGRGEVIYEVIDNGQGFDMRFADKLFGLFERLHGDDEIEGTGVGLAMVARIVKRHGGRVWADGQPGQGARFSFSLPRQEEAL